MTQSSDGYFSRAAGGAAAGVSRWLLAPLAAATVREFRLLLSSIGSCILLDTLLGESEHPSAETTEHADTRSLFAVRNNNSYAVFQRLCCKAYL